MTPDFYVGVVLRDGRKWVFGFWDGPCTVHEIDCVSGDPGEEIFFSRIMVFPYPVLVYCAKFPAFMKLWDEDTPKMWPQHYATSFAERFKEPPSKDIANVYMFEHFEPPPLPASMATTGVISVPAYQTQIRDPRSEEFLVMKRKAA